MSESTTDLPAASIDWSSISHDIHCPLCRYNLRGLSEPRCPECGCRFEWIEVLDPHGRHPYLFEHQPQRNIWSFVRTLWGGLNARRFWARLRPAHKVIPRRLMIYWALCSCFVVLLLAAELLRIGAIVASNNASLRVVLPARMPGRFTPAQLQKFLDTQFPLPPSSAYFRQVLNSAAADYTFSDASLNISTILLWPWLTLGALMVFQASMRRAKVQPSHVLRCVIYSADASVWYLVSVILAMVVLIITISMRGGIVSRLWPYEMTLVLMWALWLVRLDRLWVAYKKYLQFDHPFLTALASQILVLLAGAALLFWGGRVIRWMIWGVWRL